MRTKFYLKNLKARDYLEDERIINAMTGYIFLDSLKTISFLIVTLLCEVV
jgi:hypothetical protein